jgi:hypothetical protein
MSEQRSDDLTYRAAVTDLIDTWQTTLSTMDQVVLETQPDVPSLQPYISQGQAILKNFQALSVPEQYGQLHQELVTSWQTMLASLDSVQMDATNREQVIRTALQGIEETRRLLDLWFTPDSQRHTGSAQ